jgi:hypothetical protein
MPARPARFCIVARVWTSRTTKPTLLWLPGTAHPCRRSAAPCARLDAGGVVGALVIRLRGKVSGTDVMNSKKGRVDALLSRLASRAMAALATSRRRQTTARAG